jgi:DNA-binding NtrC family response regulator
VSLVELVVYERDGSKVATLRRGESLIVGRTTPAQLVVPDPALSRQHARFEWPSTSEAITVEDLNSTNGTTVRGRKVKRAELEVGGSAELGPLTVCVRPLAPGQGPRREICGNDRLMVYLEAELARARTFGRALALVVVRAGGRERVHVSRWEHRVQAVLRPVDQLSLYGQGALLVLMPELAGPEVRSALARIAGDEPPSLVFGVAVFPEDGTSAHELIESARRAAEAATPPDASPQAGGRPAVRIPTQPSFEAVALPAPRLQEPDTLEHTAVSPAMREVSETVSRVAAAVAPVLILGETGVGKELVARSIHQKSPRAGKAFKAVNCAAMPAALLESLLFGHEKGAFTGAERSSRGLFEQASGGTVFLDEIGELAPPAQAALLRVLETKRVTRIGSDEEVAVDVRVVAATHRDLEAMCSAGTFRLDLLYRLNTVTLRIPPLREREQEIPILAEMFLTEANQAAGGAVKGISTAAMERLRAYAWPGNVRELRNVIERAVMISRDSLIQPEDLPEPIRAGSSDRGRGGGEAAFHISGERSYAEFQEQLRQWTKERERELLVDALRRHGGNQTEAARSLRMPLRTLVHKIRTLGIKKKFEPT